MEYQVEVYAFNDSDDYNAVETAMNSNVSSNWWVLTTNTFVSGLNTFMSVVYVKGSNPVRLDDAPVVTYLPFLGF